jgi:subtilisin family serine protease
LPGTLNLGQLSVDFEVVGANGQPLEKVQIELTGKTFQGKAATGKDGKATVVIVGEAPNTIMSLYVKPWADHWDRFVQRPALSVPGLNTITLQPLSATFPNFPGQQTVGWGQELMGLAQIPSHLNGQGVKIAIIDSGCDNSHPLLKHIKQGLNLNSQGDAATWNQDEIAHGTHCAGVIAGSSPGGQGIRGFAPGAEVHIFKVFPEGRFDTLIRALDICIERQIDVVNCSLGSSQPNSFVTNKLEEARQNGVACIVAAGNSGGPVQFPATLPTVLSVSALGQQQRFPADSQHARTAHPALVGLNGVFPASFSCFGPEIRVSGPGVAVVSTVPGGGYAAWDGTSMAAPHITGLAALVLAHHPAFTQQPALRARSAARVDSLFQLLVAACAPLVADSTRGGAGLPQAVPLLGAAPAAAAAGAPAGAAAASAPAAAAGATAAAQPGQTPADAALLQALAPVIAGLAGGGAPAGGLLAALLGQTLASGGIGFGAPFGGFPGAGGYAAPPAYGMGAGGLPPHVLMQLRSLGLV